MKKKIAILASGTGSNAEAIARYFADSDTCQVALLISDKPDAGALKRMEALGVPCKVFTKPEWTSPERGGNGGANVLKLLRDRHIDIVALAGFLPFLPDALVNAMEGRILNIHPSLLPKYGGKGMWGHHVHEAVLAAGETESGITIHLVTKELDKGAPLCQARCQVLPTDTPDTLAARIHHLEHTHYPRVIDQLARSLPDD